MKNKFIEVKRREIKMKKLTTGFMVFSIIALFGVSFASAFPFGFAKGPMAQDLTDDELSEMQEFQNDVFESIENADFNTWKTLMQSQLTEENFNKIIERHNNRAELGFERGQYNEYGNCPMINGDRENLQRGMRMHAFQALN